MTQADTRERPILFSAPMVRAILAGTKTQTRRIMKPEPPEWFSPVKPEWYSPTIVRGDEEFPGPDVFGTCNVEGDYCYKCPYGAPGDRLWVRETHYVESEKFILYRADDALGDYPVSRWTPSIFMPRGVSRITLEVTDIRVERVQAITEADARAEGCPCYVCGRRMDGLSEDDCHCFHKHADANDYSMLWESINGRASWEANPWVWVVTFKRTA